MLKQGIKLDRTEKDVEVKHIKKVSPLTKATDSANETKSMTASTSDRPPREGIGCIPVGAGL
jgi:hypothetical protein